MDCLVETHRDLIGFAPSSPNPRFRIMYKHKRGVNPTSVVCLKQPEWKLSHPTRPLGRQLRGNKVRSARPHNLPRFPDLQGLENKATRGLCKLCNYYTKVTVSNPSLCKGVMNIHDIYNKYSESISYRVQSRLYNHATEQEYVSAAKEMIYLRNLFNAIAIPKPPYEAIKNGRSCRPHHPRAITEDLAQLPTEEQSVIKLPQMQYTPVHHASPEHPVFLTCIVDNAKDAKRKMSKSVPGSENARKTPGDVIKRKTQEAVPKNKQKTSVSDNIKMKESKERTQNVQAKDQDTNNKRVQMRGCPSLGVTYVVMKTHAEVSAGQCQPDPRVDETLQKKSLALINVQLPQANFATAVRMY